MTNFKSFFIESSEINDDQFKLNKKESHHAKNVLRVRTGESLILLDGKGYGYIAKIKKINNGFVYGKILKKVEKFGENKTLINVVPAVIKRHRFENLIEKATELGAKNIIPIITDRCMKKTINISRCEKLIISAAKQCNRSLFPSISKPLKLKEWLKINKGQCFAGSMKSHKKLSDYTMKKSKIINIIIGPEGDFNKKEMNIMNNSGVKFYNLGIRKLRAETAMQASLSILNELYG